MKRFTMASKIFGVVLGASILVGGIGHTPVTHAASAKNPYIMGASVLDADQMASFVKDHVEKTKLSTITIKQLAELYLEVGEEEGVRGDVAFAQAIKETGYFTFGGDVLPSQNNYSGIGAVGGKAKGATFKTPEEGVRAQIQHLKAYGSTRDLETPLVDPRFKYVERGSAPTWPQLHRKWAMQPSGNYGEDILAIYEDMSNE